MARSTRAFSPTAALRRNALYKGLFGGSRGWLAVGAVVWGPRLMKTSARSNREGRRHRGAETRPGAVPSDDPAGDALRNVALLAAIHEMNTPFAYGEKVLLLDLKQRRYLITLAEGAEFHSHNGFFAHSDLVGQLEGIVVKSTKGSPYTALRPTLEDFVVEMPRGAQVIYPKDLAPMCMLADIGPGVRVLESGVGSGRPQHDDAAMGSRDRRLRVARRLRQPSQGQRAQLSR